MKRIISGVLISSISLSAFAQQIEQVYDRDTHESFKLKSHHTDTVVKGPMVKQKSLFIYDNPAKKLTEASYWFSLPAPSVLSGFAYWYKDEYVPGTLMDKNKAWFIYTAITSRNEDPGIMVQTSPSSYHAQIFPLAQGYDLKVELTSVGFLEYSPEGLLIPEPDVESLEGRLDNFTSKVAVPKSQATKKVTVDGASRTAIGNPSTDPTWVQYYAQRHKDGHTYVVGMIHTNRPNDPFEIRGLTNVYWARPENGPQDGTVKLFMGRRDGAGKFEVVSDLPHSTEILKGVVRANERGDDTAKLWANQKLVHMEYARPKDILKFSMKYQIPSSETALLAVPQEEMKLFREKAAEYQRQQREEARQKREWEKNRRLNWNNSTGGDPEIRIQMPDAISVKAILPDGREFDLKKDAKGFWGGNFDIPASAAEGEYTVRIVGTKADGSTFEETLNYTVDRTAPTGEISVEKGFYYLKPSETLARAVAVFGSGEETDFIPADDGRLELPAKKGRIVKVMLIDQAHNIGEMKCSP
ncbi:MAG: hypothetical protein JST12_15585 [Armatimonadetes bacterium]|nr:hypothetical protein [Armatimonadota bacterium]